ncbi:hypothetical protein ABPG73_016833 [Tetrahymena malaccensis]
MGQIRMSVILITYLNLIQNICLEQISIKVKIILDSKSAQIKLKVMQNQIVDPLAIAQTLEFRICIQEQFMEYRDYPNYTNVVPFNNKNAISINGQYYFGFQITYDSLGDKLEIFDCQELDQFPNNSKQLTILQNKNLYFDNYYYLITIKRMNKNLCCDIHSHCPIFHIDVLQGAQKKLQCLKCISNKKLQINLLYIPEIINYSEKTFLENWPPLSDEFLRTKLIKLQSEDKDYKQTILDFYEQLAQELIDIISQKKKEQLLQVERLNELKEKILEKYFKMASLDKISECLSQESQQIEKMEKDLKEQIDSQIRQKEEYTSILQCMMRQYELINQLNTDKQTQLKQNIMEILKIVNLLPQNNFNFEDEIYTYSSDNIKTQNQKLDEEYQKLKNDKNKVDNLIKLLDFSSQQLVKNMNQVDWNLDEFFVNQQNLILKNQYDSAEFLKNTYLNIYQLRYLTIQNASKYGQKEFKYLNELKYNLSILDQSTSFIQNSDFLKFEKDYQNVIKITKIKQNSQININGRQKVRCYLNYILKPSKKYIFSVELKKSQKSSSFSLVLIDSLIQSNELQDSEIVYKINEPNIDENNGTNSNINTLNFKIEFRICVNQQQIIFSQYPWKPNQQYFYKNVQNKIRTYGQYYLGFFFEDLNKEDSIEIFDYQELDYFP